MTLDERTIRLDGSDFRIATRAGRPGAVPLLACNGLGATVGLFGPVADALDGIPFVAFDPPGIGGSADPGSPYRLPWLAGLAGRLMTAVGHPGAFDVLGFSWGGALAQQVALDHRHRCRRAVLAATTAGAIAIPGSWSTLRHLVSPAHRDREAFIRDIAPKLYGGGLRRDPERLRPFLPYLTGARGRGFRYQLLAGTGWTSAWRLPMMRQPTLVLAGSEDPIVPLANGRLLATLIPDATLSVIDDGHLFLVDRIDEVGPVIRRFLTAPDGADPAPSAIIARPSATR